MYLERSDSELHFIPLVYELPCFGMKIMPTSITLLLRYLTNIYLSIFSVNQPVFVRVESKELVNGILGFATGC
jgi:hypothetical protein